MVTLLRPTSALPTPLRRLQPSRLRPRASLRPAMDFPFLAPPFRSLVSDILLSLSAAVPTPSAASPLFHFQSPSAASSGALLLLPGHPSSPLDLLLHSWIHSELPALDIVTLNAYLRPAATDAPHLLFELIQTGPASAVLVTDLLPRRDLVLHTDYLHRFYEASDLDRARRDLLACPQVSPYVSRSLYVRSALSPTAIAVAIACADAAEMEELVVGPVGTAVRQVVQVWVERCACAPPEPPLPAEEVESLRRRDAVMKRKTIEVDLTANLPRLFGEEVAAEVVEAVERAFGV